MWPAHLGRGAVGSMAPAGDDLRRVSLWVAESADRHPLSGLVSVRDPPALPGRHPEFDSSGIGMRNSST